MNKVILVGRLTRDPEIRYSQSAEPLAVTRYSLAVNRRFKREGEPDADFINCVSFGKAAEFANKYYKKGQMVAVSGRLQISSWEDQTGQKRWSTDVIIEDQTFAESKTSYESRESRDSQADRDMAQARQESGQNQMFFEPDGFSAIAESIDDEELPF